MTMRSIESVAVVGGGTMGMGIAALAAEKGCRVLLLDMTTELADKAVARMQAGRSPVLDDPEKLALIKTGSVEDDIGAVADYDWICEAVIEDLEAKRAIFEKLEEHRKDGSIITTNTSGIPLKDIIDGMPERLQQDVAVTHFFNPVKIMRLLELVPGRHTTDEVINTLTSFCRNTLGKGVVNAKDTVNFIGNRIGCMWMLAGLHKGVEARAAGLTIEEIDALLSNPIGLPPTGMYGLVDLIGLDIMDSVAKNLEENLPDNDAGKPFTSLPAAEQAMLERKQLGRKTGGGYYRINKGDDGSKTKEVFELESGEWRTANEVELDEAHAAFPTLVTQDTPAGRFVWDIMSSTCCYAADLIPEISDDIVNIDRAMRWGFAWKFGPFELIDQLGANTFVEMLEAEGRPVPAMLKNLKDSGATRFYRPDGAEYIGTDGNYHPVPEE